MVITSEQLRNIELYGIKGPGVGRYPFPVPNGWFGVARSDDLRPGETKNAHFFGRDLVVWREEGSGTPHVVDAYCAHLGAHLGVGSGAVESHEPGPGTVAGACLQCPFHGWRYDGSGRCVEIPYAPDVRIPARAKVRAYPAIERNGMIFAWHHLRDEPPLWDLPIFPEFDNEEWEGPIYTERFIAAAIQEIHENDQDTVHFLYVHGAESIPEQTTRWEGRMRVTEAKSRDGSTFTREYCQMGFGIMRVADTLLFMSVTTPVDEGNTLQRWVFAYNKRLGAEVGQQMVDAFAKSGIYQDIPIWEHKLYRDHPVLVKGDGEIAEFRRWAHQFYSWPDDGSATVGVPADGAPVREHQLA